MRHTYLGGTHTEAPGWAQHQVRQTLGTATLGTGWVGGLCELPQNAT